MDIGEKIRKARKEAGLTQEKLGELVNKSAQVISNWERGYTSTINHDDVTRLTLALKVPPGYLLGIDRPTISKEERKTSQPNNALDELSEEDRKEAIRYINYLKHTSLGDGETSATLEKRGGDQVGNT